MPGRMFLDAPTAEIEKYFGVAAPETVSARYNIAPGEDVLVFTDAGLQWMRWGLIPVGRVNARGRPVMETIINARSETVLDKSAFQGVARCIVPASGWYEWTGKKGRKTAWRIRPATGGLLAFAAISDVWNAPGGRDLWQVATVTCEPSGDVRDIHDRMGVILQKDQLPTWLSGTDEDVRALMKPLPGGSLIVEDATGVDWDAP